MMFYLGSLRTLVEEATLVFWIWSGLDVELEKGTLK
jgi:hypothetical protein